MVITEVDARFGNSILNFSFVTAIHLSKI